MSFPAIRSSRDSILTIGLFSNLFMVAAVSLTFVLQMLVVYWPPFQNIFGTQALRPWELGLALGMSLVVFVAVEIEKWFRRRRS